LGDHWNYRLQTDNILFNFHANLIGCFQSGCFAHAYTIARSHDSIVSLAPITTRAGICFFVPMAEKSEHPVPRVVGDSRQLVFSERIATCQKFDLPNSRMFA
jgi:hypothetical protein